MSELRAGAPVEAVDGRVGIVDALVVDPTTITVTHVVVAEQRLGPRVLVPISAVERATPELVTLRLDRAGLEACPLFDEPAFLTGETPLSMGGHDLDPGAYFLQPYASPVDPLLLAEHERIPAGEVTFRRGDEVRTSDGARVGHVDELLVDPSDGHITHVVLREGHLLAHDEDVVVPIAGASFTEGVVTLALDVAAVHALPHVPVRRGAHIHRS